MTQSNRLSVATLVFAYNRPKHVEKVIESLRENEVHPQKLFIFHDGPNENTDMDKWKDTRAVIESVDWCNVEIVAAEKNKGLADSIVDGVGYALQEYDSVIVLEDDCVTHPQFMEYMAQSLNKYKDAKQVWSINGYSWAADVTPNGTDAYFAGRFGSWGWATWKDRWSEYRQDYKILSRIKNDEHAKKQIDIWGKDLESYLHGNVDGRCNSWAVFAALLVLERHSYCLTPYRSLVKNIGFDGSGVHCGTGEIKTNLCEKDDRSNLVLPDKIEFPDNYATAYRDVFWRTAKETKMSCYFDILYKWMKIKNESKSIADYLSKQDISKVSIWGKGKVSELLIEELRGKADITAIVESNPNMESWHDIPVVSIEHIPSETQKIIVIPVYDIDRIRLRVSNQQLLLGLDEILEAMLPTE